MEERIEYANAKTITLTLETEAGTGALTDSGKNDIKVGYTFNLSFTPKTEDYVFLGWTCIDSSNKEDASACVEFADILSSKTSVKILKDKAITISPKCAIRPKIKNFSPEYDQTGNGVSKNTSIIIEFEKALDVPAEEPEKTEYLKKIIVESNGPVTDKFSPSVSENIVTLVSKDLIDCKSGTQEVNVKIPGSYYYTIKNVKNENVKVYLSGEYNGEDIVYVTKTYLVNNTTSDKAEIYFYVDSESGKLDYVGLKTLNIGDNFTVTFTNVNAGERFPEFADFRFPVLGKKIY